MWTVHVDLGWRPPPTMVKPAGKGRCRGTLDLELSLDSYSGAPRGPRASHGPLLGLQSKVTNFMSQGSSQLFAGSARRLSPFFSLVLQCVCV